MNFLMELKERMDNLMRESWNEPLPELETFRKTWDKRGKRPLDNDIKLKWVLEYYEDNEDFL